MNDPAAPLGRAELEGLIDWSQGGHAAHGLTGLLLYSGGHQLQVLEGPAEAVAMAEQIDARAGRVRRVHRLSCEVTDERLFNGWTVRQLNLATVPTDDQARLRWLVEWAADPAVAANPGDVRELLDCLQRRVAA